jgi:hypothetical protein
VVSDAIDYVRGRRVANGGGGRPVIRFEVGDVNDTVVAKVGRKVQFVDDGGSNFQDFVGSVEFWSQFPPSAKRGRWVQEGGLDPSKRAEGKGDVVTVAVGGETLGCLGCQEGLTGLTVEGLDVGCEVRSVGGAEGRGIGREGRGGEGVVAVVEEKGRAAGGSVDRVVVGEFGRGEVEIPIILESGDV